jgi:hypothetical protein
MSEVHLHSPARSGESVLELYEAPELILSGTFGNVTTLKGVHVTGNYRDRSMQHTYEAVRGSRIDQCTTKGPSGGYPRGRFWDLGTILEPF